MVSLSRPSLLCAAWQKAVRKHAIHFAVQCASIMTGDKEKDTLLFVVSPSLFFPAAQWVIAKMLVFLLGVIQFASTCLLQLAHTHNFVVFFLLLLCLPFDPITSSHLLSIDWLADWTLDTEGKPQQHFYSCRLTCGFTHIHSLLQILIDRTTACQLCGRKCLLLQFFRLTRLTSSN